MDPLLRLLAAQAQQDDKPRSYPQLEAQMDMLNHLLRMAAMPRPFTRGDRVHYPTGMGPLLPEAHIGLALIFWRDVDPRNAYDNLRMRKALDTELSSFPDIDCMLAFFNGREAVQFHLGCKALLLPGPFQP